MTDPRDIPLEYDRLAIEVFERTGRRGELHFQAAMEGVDVNLLIAWADTSPQELK